MTPEPLTTPTTNESKNERSTNDDLLHDQSLVSQTPCFPTHCYLYPKSSASVATRVQLKDLPTTTPFETKDCTLCDEELTRVAGNILATYAAKDATEIATEAEMKKKFIFVYCLGLRRYKTLTVRSYTAFYWSDQYWCTSSSSQAPSDSISYSTTRFSAPHSTFCACHSFKCYSRCEMRGHTKRFCTNRRRSHCNDRTRKTTLRHNTDCWKIHY